VKQGDPPKAWRLLLAVLGLLGLFAVSSGASAATRFSVAASGNWNATSTWSTSCGGAPGSSVPGAGDDANICAGTTVTVNVATTVNTVTICPAASAPCAPAATLNGSSNQLTIDNTTALTINEGGVFNPGTGTVLLNGDRNTTVVSGGTNVTSVTFNNLTISFTTTGARVYTLSAGSITQVNVTNNLSIVTTGTNAARSLTLNMTDPLDVGGTTLIQGGGTGPASAILNTSVTNYALTSGRLTIAASGVLTANGSTVTLDGATGPLLTRAGTLTAGTHKVIMKSTASVALTSGTVAFNDLEVDMANQTGTLGANITASGNVNIKAGTLADGGFTITGAATRTFSIAEDATFRTTRATQGVTAFGTFNYGTTGNCGTYDYAGAAQTVAATPPGYGNLNLSGSGTKTMPATALSVACHFSISGASTAATARSAMTVGGHFTIGATTTFTAVTTANLTHNVGGNFTNSGTFTPNAGAFVSTFNFNGTAAAAQTISGSPTAPTFSNLTIDNTGSPGGVTLGSNVSTTNLALTSGVVTTATNTLSATTACNSVNYTRGNGWVAGFLSLQVPTGSPSCTFHVGDGTSYRPVAIVFNTVGTAGSLRGSVTQTAGEHPNIATSDLDSGYDVNRYWTLTNTGIALTSYDATFTFVSGDADTNASPTTFEVARWNGASWSATTVGTRTGTTTQATGLTSFSDFAIGQRRLNNFLIAVPGSPGSTCVPQTVSIIARNSGNQTLTNYRGLVNLSTSTLHGDWSVNSANGTLTNGAADDGAATYQFVASDNGGISLRLTDNHADTLTVGVADIIAGVSTPSASLTFSGNSFVITNDTIQVAGRNQSMSVALNGSASCTNPLSGYTGSKNLKAWYTPVSGDDPGGTAPTIVGMTGAPLGNAAPASSNLTLAFTNGSASFSLATSDVGKYQVNLRDDAGSFAGTPATPVQVDGTSGVITTRPFALVVSDVKQGATANPNGTATAGSKFVAAGTAFQASLGAYRWSAAADTDDNGVPDVAATLASTTAGGLAPKYSWPVTLAASTPITPAAGGLGTFGGGAVAAGDYSNGAATATGLTYSEVGSFTLTGVANPNFLNTSGVNLAAIVFDSGGARNGVVGRFYPDHFTLTASTLAAACSAFTYMGHNGIGYSYSIEARNTSNVKTSNYFTTGYTTGTVALAAENGANGTDLGTRLTAGSGSWSTGTYAISATTTTFSRPASPDGPFETLKIGIKVNDTDGPVLASPDMLTSTAVGLGGATKVRFGRLQMQNAHGTQALNLAIPVELQYWNGTVWARNTDDTCTPASLAPGNFAFGNHTGQLVGNYPSAGNVAVGAFAAGLGSITLTKPASSLQGSVDVALNLGTTGSATTCAAFAPNSNATAANKSYLQGQWCAGGYIKDPVAKATFGIYNNKFIFRREMY
jgi:hypothetical protein